MTDITPADLAKFIYRVPVGATIPADTRYASLNFGCVTGPMHSYADQKILGGTYWTAEPIPAPELTLAQRARALIPHDLHEWPDMAITSLAVLVAELAERIEAKP